MVDCIIWGYIADKIGGVCKSLIFENDKGCGIFCKNETLCEC